MIVKHLLLTLHFANTSHLCKLRCIPFLLYSINLPFNADVLNHSRNYISKPNMEGEALKALEALKDDSIYIELHCHAGRRQSVPAHTERALTAQETDRRHLSLTSMYIQPPHIRLSDHAHLFPHGDAKLPQAHNQFAASRSKPLRVPRPLTRHHLPDKPDRWQVLLEDIEYCAKRCPNRECAVFASDLLNFAKKVEKSERMQGNTVQNGASCRSAMLNALNFLLTFETNSEKRYLAEQLLETEKAGMYIGKCISGGRLEQDTKDSTAVVKATSSDFSGPTSHRKSRLKDQSRNTVLTTFAATRAIKEELSRARGTEKSTTDTRPDDQLSAISPSIVSVFTGALTAAFTAASSALGYREPLFEPEQKPHDAISSLKSVLKKASPVVAKRIDSVETLGKIQRRRVKWSPTKDMLGEDGIEVAELVIDNEGKTLRAPRKRMRQNERRTIDGIQQRETPVRVAVRHKEMGRRSLVPMVVMR